MQLIDVIKSFCVGHMYPDKLKQVLRQEHPTVHVKRVVNGTILMSEGITLKCVEHYYEHPTDKTKIMCNNLITRCRIVRRRFGLEGVINDLDCVNCHYNCLNLVDEHELVRKKKKGRKLP